jgi:hypothetical protein
MGLWQFMPATASRFQLQVTSWVDERLDAAKSTGAALSYLEQLYRIFGDWFLAVASYNAGEDRVQREMRRQGVVSYYDLVLPSETERYVFRIAAAKIILGDPRVYGFDLQPEELYKPFDSEKVEIEVERDLDLIALAQGSGMTYRTLRTRNPHLRESSLPKGQYELYVPSDKKKAVSAFIQGWNPTAMRGESRVTGVQPKASSAPAPKSAGDATEKRGGKTVHSVQNGETLSVIAQKYKVTVKEIQEWNELGNSVQIRPGQKLTIRK